MAFFKRNKLTPTQSEPAQVSQGVLDSFNTLLDLSTSDKPASTSIPSQEQPAQTLNTSSSGASSSIPTALKVEPQKVNAPDTKQETNTVSRSHEIELGDLTDVELQLPEFNDITAGLVQEAQSGLSVEKSASATSQASSSPVKSAFLDLKEPQQLVTVERAAQHVPLTHRRVSQRQLENNPELQGTSLFVEQVELGDVTQVVDHAQVQASDFVSLDPHHHDEHVTYAHSLLETQVPQVHALDEDQLQEVLEQSHPRDLEHTQPHDSEATIVQGLQQLVTNTTSKSKSKPLMHSASKLLKPATPQPLDAILNLKNLPAPTTSAPAQYFVDRDVPLDATAVAELEIPEVNLHEVQQYLTEQDTVPVETKDQATCVTQVALDAVETVPAELSWELTTLDPERAPEMFSALLDNELGISSLGNDSCVTSVVADFPNLLDIVTDDVLASARQWQEGDQLVEVAHALGTFAPQAGQAAVTTLVTGVESAVSASQALADFETAIATDTPSSTTTPTLSKPKVDANITNAYNPLNRNSLLFKNHNYHKQAVTKQQYHKVEVNEEVVSSIDSQAPEIVSSHLTETAVDVGEIATTSTPAVVTTPAQEKSVVQESVPEVVPTPTVVLSSTVAITDVSSDTAPAPAKPINIIRPQSPLRPVSMPLVPRQAQLVSEVSTNSATVTGTAVPEHASLRSTDVATPKPALQEITLAEFTQLEKERREALEALVTQPLAQAATESVTTPEQEGDASTDAQEQVTTFVDSLPQEPLEVEVEKFQTASLETTSSARRAILLAPPSMAALHAAMSEVEAATPSQVQIAAPALELVASVPEVDAFVETSEVHTSVPANTAVPIAKLISPPILGGATFLAPPSVERKEQVSEDKVLENTVTSLPSVLDAEGELEAEQSRASIPEIEVQAQAELAVAPVATQDAVASTAQEEAEPVLTQIERQSLKRKAQELEQQARKASKNPQVASATQVMAQANEFYEDDDLAEVDERPEFFDDPEIAAIAAEVASTYQQAQRFKRNRHVPQLGKKPDFTDLDALIATIAPQAVLGKVQASAPETERGANVGLGSGMGALLGSPQAKSLQQKFAESRRQGAAPIAPPIPKGLAGMAALLQQAVSAPPQPEPKPLAPPSAPSMIAPPSVLGSVRALEPSSLPEPNFPSVVAPPAENVFAPPVVQADLATSQTLYRTSYQAADLAAPPSEVAHLSGEQDLEHVTQYKFTLLPAYAAPRAGKSTTQPLPTAHLKLDKQTLAATTWDELTTSYIANPQVAETPLELLEIFAPEVQLASRAVIATDEEYAELQEQGIIPNETGKVSTATETANEFAPVMDETLQLTSVGDPYPEEQLEAFIQSKLAALEAQATATSVSSLSSGIGNWDELEPEIAEEGLAYWGQDMILASDFNAAEVTPELSGWDSATELGMELKLSSQLDPTTIPTLAIDALPAISEVVAQIEDTLVSATSSVQPVDFAAVLEASQEAPAGDVATLSACLQDEVVAQSAVDFETIPATRSVTTSSVEPSEQWLVSSEAELATTPASIADQSAEIDFSGFLSLADSETPDTSAHDSVTHVATLSEEQAQASDQADQAFLASVTQALDLEKVIPAHGLRNNLKKIGEWLSSEITEADQASEQMSDVAEVLDLSGAHSQLSATHTQAGSEIRAPESTEHNSVVAQEVEASDLSEFGALLDLETTQAPVIPSTSHVHATVSTSLSSEEFPLEVDTQLAQVLISSSPLTLTAHNLENNSVTSDHKPTPDQDIATQLIEKFERLEEQREQAERTEYQQSAVQAIEEVLAAPSQSRTFVPSDAADLAALAAKSATPSETPRRGIGVNNVFIRPQVKPTSIATTDTESGKYKASVSLDPDLVLASTTTTVADTIAEISDLANRLAGEQDVVTQLFAEDVTPKLAGNLGLGVTALQAQQALAELNQVHSMEFTAVESEATGESSSATQVQANHTTYTVGKLTPARGEVDSEISASAAKLSPVTPSATHFASPVSVGELSSIASAPMRMIKDSTLETEALSETSVSSSLTTDNLEAAASKLSEVVPEDTASADVVVLARSESISSNTTEFLSEADVAHRAFPAATLNSTSPSSSELATSPTPTSLHVEAGVIAQTVFTTSATVVDQSVSESRATPAVNQPTYNTTLVGFLDLSTSPVSQSNPRGGEAVTHVGKTIARADQAHATLTNTSTITSTVAETAPDAAVLTTVDTKLTAHASLAPATSEAEIATTPEIISDATASSTVGDLELGTPMAAFATLEGDFAAIEELVRDVQAQRGASRDQQAVAEIAHFFEHGQEALEESVNSQDVFAASINDQDEEGARFTARRKAGMFEDESEVAKNEYLKSLDSQRKAFVESLHAATPLITELLRVESQQRIEFARIPVPAPLVSAILAQGREFLVPNASPTARELENEYILSGLIGIAGYLGRELEISVAEEQTSISAESTVEADIAVPQAQVELEAAPANAFPTNANLNNSQQGTQEVASTVSTAQEDVTVPVASATSQCQTASSSVRDSTAQEEFLTLNLENVNSVVTSVTGTGEAKYIATPSTPELLSSGGATRVLQAHHLSNSHATRGACYHSYKLSLIVLDQSTPAHHHTNVIVSVLKWATSTIKQFSSLKIKGFARLIPAPNPLSFGASVQQQAVVNGKLLGYGITTRAACFAAQCRVLVTRIEMMKRANIRFFARREQQAMLREQEAQHAELERQAQLKLQAEQRELRTNLLEQLEKKREQLAVIQNSESNASTQASESVEQQDSLQIQDLTTTSPHATTQDELTVHEVQKTSVIPSADVSSVTNSASPLAEVALVARASTETTVPSAEQVTSTVEATQPVETQHKGHVLDMFFTATTASLEQEVATLEAQLEQLEEQLVEPELPVEIATQTEYRLGSMELYHQAWQESQTLLAQQGRATSFLAYDHVHGCQPVVPAQATLQQVNWNAEYRPTTPQDYVLEQQLELRLPNPTAQDPGSKYIYNSHIRVNQVKPEEAKTLIKTLLTSLQGKQRRASAQTASLEATNAANFNRALNQSKARSEARAQIRTRVQLDANGKPVAYGPEQINPKSRVYYTRMNLQSETNTDSTLYERVSESINQQHLNQQVVSGSAGIAISDSNTVFAQGQATQNALHIVARNDVGTAELATVSGAMTATTTALAGDSVVPATIEVAENGVVANVTNFGQSATLDAYAASVDQLTTALEQATHPEYATTRGRGVIMSAASVEAVPDMLGVSDPAPALATNVTSTPLDMSEQVQAFGTESSQADVDATNLAEQGLDGADDASLATPSVRTEAISASAVRNTDPYAPVITLESSVGVPVVQTPLSFDATAEQAYLEQLQTEIVQVEAELAQLAIEPQLEIAEFVAEPEPTLENVSSEQLSYLEAQYQEKYEILNALEPIYTDYEIAPGAQELELINYEHAQYILEQLPLDIQLAQFVNLDRYKRLEYWSEVIDCEIAYPETPQLTYARRQLMEIGLGYLIDNPDPECQITEYLYAQLNANDVAVTGSFQLAELEVFTNYQEELRCAILEAYIDAYNAGLAYHAEQHQLTNELHAIRLRHAKEQERALHRAQQSYAVVQQERYQAYLEQVEQQQRAHAYELHTRATRKEQLELQYAELKRLRAQEQRRLVEQEALRKARNPHSATQDQQDLLAYYESGEFERDMHEEQLDAEYLALQAELAELGYGEFFELDEQELVHKKSGTEQRASTPVATVVQENGVAATKQTPFAVKLDTAQVDIEVQAQPQLQHSMDNMLVQVHGVTIDLRQSTADLMTYYPPAIIPEIIALHQELYILREWIESFAKQLVDLKIIPDLGNTPLDFFARIRREYQILGIIKQLQQEAQYPVYLDVVLQNVGVYLARYEAGLLSYAVPPHVETSATSALNREDVEVVQETDVGVGTHPEVMHVEVAQVEAAHEVVSSSEVTTTLATSIGTTTDDVAPVMVQTPLNLISDELLEEDFEPELSTTTSHLETSVTSMQSESNEVTSEEVRVANPVIRDEDLEEEIPEEITIELVQDAQGRMSFSDGTPAQANWTTELSELDLASQLVAQAELVVQAEEQEDDTTSHEHLVPQVDNHVNVVTNASTTVEAAESFTPSVTSISDNLAEDLVAESKEITLVHSQVDLDNPEEQVTIASEVPLFNELDALLAPTTIVATARSTTSYESLSLLGSGRELHFGQPDYDNLTPEGLDLSIINQATPGLTYEDPFSPEERNAKPEGIFRYNTIDLQKDLDIPELQNPTVELADLPPAEVPKKSLAKSKAKAAAFEADKAPEVEASARNSNSEATDVQDGKSASQQVVQAHSEASIDKTHDLQISNLDLLMELNPEQAENVVISELALDDAILSKLEQSVEEATDQTEMELEPQASDVSNNAIPLDVQEGAESLEDRIDIDFTQESVEVAKHQLSSTDVQVTEYLVEAVGEDAITTTACEVEDLAVHAEFVLNTSATLAVEQETIVTEIQETDQSVVANITPTAEVILEETPTTAESVVAAKQEVAVELPVDLEVIQAIPETKEVVSGEVGSEFERESLQTVDLSGETELEQQELAPIEFVAELGTTAEPGENLEAEASNSVDVDVSGVENIEVAPEVNQPIALSKDSASVIDLEPVLTADTLVSEHEEVHRSVDLEVAVQEFLSFVPEVKQDEDISELDISETSQDSVASSVEVVDEEPQVLENSQEEVTVLESSASEVTASDVVGTTFMSLSDTEIATVTTITAETDSSEVYDSETEVQQEAEEIGFVDVENSILELAISQDISAARTEEQDALNVIVLGYRSEVEELVATQTELEPESEAELGVDVEAETETDVDAEVELMFEAESVSEVKVDVDAETETETDFEVATESEPKPEVELEDGTDSDSEHAASVTLVESTSEFEVASQGEPVAISTEVTCLSDGEQAPEQVLHATEQEIEQDTEDADVSDLSISSVVSTTHEATLADSLASASVGAFSLSNLLAQNAAQPAKVLPDEQLLEPTEIFTDEAVQLNNYIRYLRPLVEQVDSQAQIVERLIVANGHRYEIIPSAKVRVERFVACFHELLETSKNASRLHVYQHQNQVYIVRKIETAVRLRDLVSQEKHAEQVVVGVDLHNHKQTLSLAQKNTIICGSNASKRNLWLQFLATLVYQHAPEDLELVIFADRLEQHPAEVFNHLPHLLHPIFSQSQEYELICLLAAELLNRRRKCALLDTPDFIAYNQVLSLRVDARQQDLTKIKPLYVFIDSLSTTFIKACDNPADSSKFNFLSLLYFMQQGRKLGINFVNINSAAEVKVLRNKRLFTQQLLLDQSITQAQVAEVFAQYGVDNLSKAQFMVQDELEVYNFAQVTNRELQRLADFWSEQLESDFSPVTSNAAYTGNRGSWSRNAQEHSIRLIANNYQLLLQELTSRKFYRQVVIDELLAPAGESITGDLGKYLNFTSAGDFFTTLLTNLEEQGIIECEDGIEFEILATKVQSYATYLQHWGRKSSGA